MVNATFVEQAQSDIKQKLPKLEEFAGKNATKLLEVTNKVFVNWDQAARKEADSRMKQKAALLATALGRPPPLQKGPHGNHEVCKNKKEKRHWDRINVPIARNLDPGKMNAPIAKKGNQKPLLHPATTNQNHLKLT